MQKKSNWFLRGKGPAETFAVVCGIPQAASAPECESHFKHANRHGLSRIFTLWSSTTGSSDVLNLLEQDVLRPIRMYGEQ